MPTLAISQTDRLRCAAVHAHADLRVAARLLSRLRLFAAWQKAKTGYDRLGRILEEKT